MQGYRIYCLSFVSKTVSRLPGGANIIKERNCYMKYACEICGWEYDEETGDPENGLEPGTLFDELPDDFECPLCGAGKEDFAAV